MTSDFEILGLLAGLAGMTKEGAGSQLAETLLRSGVPSRSVSMALGGLLGGITGAASTPDEEDVLRRAGIGAAAGAGLGLGGAELARLMASRGSPGSAVGDRLSKFIDKQVYGLTGTVPRPGMEAELGVGIAGAEKELAEAAAAGKSLRAPKARVEAAKLKLDTVAGYLRGLAKSPAKTLRTSWESHGPSGKLMTVGFSALPLYKLMKGESTGEGTKGEQLGTEIGRLVGMAGTGSLPLAPSILAMMGAEHAGKAIGSRLG